MRVRYVKTYLSLGFGENGFMTTKTGKTIKIHRKRYSGDFGMGWKKEYISEKDLNYCERKK